MITKYSINLRQFNNGETDKITFPTFDQCMMYGMHKLKKALSNKTSVVEAILIEDANGRKIVVTPSDEELNYTSLASTYEVELRLNNRDGSSEFRF